MAIQWAALAVAIQKHRITAVTDTLKSFCFVCFLSAFTLQYLFKFLT